MVKKKTEAKSADYYNETKELSEFDNENALPVTANRSVTISVRFSDEELAELRARAEQAGVKVTSFIRAAALNQRARLTEPHSASLPGTWSSAPTRSPSSWLAARNSRGRQRR